MMSLKSLGKGQFARLGLLATENSPISCIITSIYRLFIGLIEPIQLFRLSTNPFLVYILNMALSDREKKLLAEMEAALTQDDPKLVSTLTGTAPTKKQSRLLAGIGLVALGLIMLISALVAKATPFGVVAFLVALAGMALVISNLPLGNSSEQNHPSGKSGKGNGAARKKRSPWSGFEERWDRRNFDN